MCCNAVNTVIILLVLFFYLSTNNIMTNFQCNKIYTEDSSSDTSFTRHTKTHGCFMFIFSRKLFLNVFFMSFVLSSFGQLSSIQSLQFFSNRQSVSFLIMYFYAPRGGPGWSEPQTSDLRYQTADRKL